jgi:hypothetical protein
VSDAVKIVAVAIVGMMLTILLVGIFLPTHYRVERSTDLDAPAEQTWAFVGDLRRQEAWSPWRTDPGAAFTYSLPSSGDGAQVGWEGASGAGTYRIVRADPPRRLDFVLEHPDVGAASGWLALEPAGTGTRVTWVVEGDHTRLVVGPWLAATMDGTLGPRLADALGQLEALVARPGSISSVRPVVDPTPAPPGTEGAGAVPAPQ